MRKDKNSIPQPAVAYKVDISSDKKTYIFHLRHCQWSDGNRITAHDFEYSWKKSIDPHSKSVTQIPDYFYPIRNATRCLLGKVSIDDVPIKALDDKTLLVELEYPAPYFLEVVASPFLFPVPKHITEKDPEWAYKSDVVCNGPFKLKEWKKNCSLKLERNIHYWDREHVNLDEVDIYVVQDNRTALNMFKKGLLDWVGSPFFRISYDISFDVLNQELEDTLIYWFAINTEKFPMNNKKLRQALSYAINRSSIVTNVFNYSAKPSMSVLPHTLSLRKEPYFQDNNKMLAKRLFKEALDEMGLSANDLPEIELSFIADSEVASRITQAVQDQWRKVLGIQSICLHSYEYNVYFDQVTKGKYEIGFMGWACVISDPLFILNSFRKKSDMMNKSNWQNSKFMNLLKVSNHAADESERKKLLIQAETILMDEMPIIPICSLNKRFAKNPKLKGEILSPLQSVDFKSAYFEPEF